MNAAETRPARLSTSALLSAATSLLSSARGANLTVKEALKHCAGVAPVHGAVAPEATRAALADALEWVSGMGWHTGERLYDKGMAGARTLHTAYGWALAHEQERPIPADLSALALRA